MNTSDATGLSGLAPGMPGNKESVLSDDVLRNLLAQTMPGQMPSGGAGAPVPPSVPGSPPVAPASGMPIGNAPMSGNDPGLADRLLAGALRPGQDGTGSGSPAGVPNGSTTGMAQGISGDQLPPPDKLMAMLIGQAPDHALLRQIMASGLNPGSMDMRAMPNMGLPMPPGMAQPMSNPFAQPSQPGPAAQPADPYGLGAPPADPAMRPTATGGGAFSPVELEAIRADFPILQQRVNGYPLAWLDNAATTQKPQAVMDALVRFYRNDNSNVHRAAHALAARATDAYEGARGIVQRLLRAKSAREIVFCRGTTEAVNLVAQAYGGSVLQPGDEVLVGELEHHANIVPWQMICKAKGATLRPIPITDIGEIDMAAYARMLSPKVKIVGLAHVSNTLGTVLPVREMTAMAHAVGARVLIDGAQGVSHMAVDVCSIGCDFYVFSGHKLFGPTGVGALYGRFELLESMPPWQGGGNMIERVRFDHTTYSPVPAKFEAGTAILAGAVGLGAAIDYIQRIGMDRIAAHEHALLDSAMKRLGDIPGVRLYGTAPGKVSVASFTLHGVDNDRIGRFLDSRGIAVRVGHHCAQPTMDRFGVQGMVRPSFAFYNTFEEVDRLISAVLEVRGRGGD